MAERTREPCGIRQEGARWSIWYGTVLLDYAASKEAAESKLIATLREELATAERDLQRASDHRDYALANIERIEREGAIITGERPNV